MRRFLAAAATAVLAVGCAGSDVPTTLENVACIACSDPRVREKAEEKCLEIEDDLGELACLVGVTSAEAACKARFCKPVADDG